MGRQNRISEPCDLLNENGHLIHPGYATRPLWRYDRKMIKAARHLTFETLGKGKKQLKGSILLTQADDDDMVIATSWKENPRAFYYNHKINCMDAEGWVTQGSKRYEFKHGTAFGGLDWGRGNWKITSSDNRFEMDFVPVLDRQSAFDLKLVKSLQHQVFGHFTGQVALDNGTVLRVKDFFGFAEDVLNWW